MVSVPYNCSLNMKLQLLEYNFGCFLKVYEGIKWKRQYASGNNNANIQIKIFRLDYIVQKCRPSNLTKLDY